MSNVRIYYESEVYEGPPEDIPSPVGVVAVVCESRSVKYYVLHTCEYYMYEKGQWFGLYTDADLIDHVLFTRPDIVLKGRWIPDERFREIIKEAETGKETWHPTRDGNGRLKRKAGTGRT